MNKLVSAGRLPAAFLLVASFCAIAAPSAPAAPPIVPPGAVPKKLFES